MEVNTLGSNWHQTHQPPDVDDPLPPERKIVLVWLSNNYLPFCGYIRIHSSGPFWVVYHGNTAIGSEVVAWADCLPEAGPLWLDSQMYQRGQQSKR